MITTHVNELEKMGEHRPDPCKIFNAHAASPSPVVIAFPFKWIAGSLSVIFFFPLLSSELLYMRSYSVSLGPEHNARVCSLGLCVWSHTNTCIRHNERGEYYRKEKPATDDLMYNKLGGRLSGESDQKRRNGWLWGGERAGGWQRQDEMNDGCGGMEEI